MKDSNESSGPKLPTITGEEFARRIRKVSQLRALTIGLRDAAMEQYRAGRIPYRPQIHIRSDRAYWEKRQAELENGGE